MNETRKPWHGVIVATALPFKDDLSVDFDAYAEHVHFLAEHGCDGVAPNGSLGEYQTLTEQERAQVVRTAVEAAPEGFTVMPGAGAYGGMETQRWAERAYEIKELAPGMDLLIGTDDTVLEMGLAGAVGWVAGYPNAIPTSTVELYRLSTSGDLNDLDRAREIYRGLHSLLRWDSKTEFVQAIKLSMDVVGHHGGVCRPPRGPLSPEIRDRVVRDTEAAVANGYAPEFAGAL